MFDPPRHVLATALTVATFTLTTLPGCGGAEDDSVDESEGSQTTAPVLSDAEQAKAAVEETLKAMQDLDVARQAEVLHEVEFADAGDKATWIEQNQPQAEQLREAGFELEDWEIGDVTMLEGEENMYALVPYTVDIKMGENQMSDDDVNLAIRPMGGGDWKVDLSVSSNPERIAQDHDDFPVDAAREAAPDLFGNE